MVLLLLALALAGCQAAPETPRASPTSTLSPATPVPTATKTPSPTATSTPTATAVPIPAADIEDLNGLELRLLHPWINAAETDFLALVETFNASNAWGIRVLPESAGSFSAVANALAGGEAGHNLFIANGFDLALAVGASNLINLSPYMRDAEWGLGAAYAPESVFAPLAPSFAETREWNYLPLAYQPALLFYNQTWAQELGFNSPPATAAELRAQMVPAAAEKLLDKDDTNNGAGGMWISDSARAPLAWYYAFGGECAASNGALAFNHEIFLEAIEFLKSAYEEDASWVGLQKKPYDYFARRQALAYEGTLDDLLEQEGYLARAGSADEFITLPYPGPDGSGSIALETLSLGIRAGSAAEQLGAWIFARWLLEDSAQETLVRVSGYWPAAGNPRDIAPDYARQHPAWASALREGVRLKLAPERENWAFSRVVLQDALRRAYQLDLAYIPTVLETLDATLLELAGSGNGE
ncbi:MAG TPA: extracellular solute-binding protein [Anaerolineaceae bacterium]|nr:extracellular solute-binding protein [Anaerolineaceae bacterium]